MVKVCLNFKNSLFAWVYLKEACFSRGYFYLVFILQNLGSLAPLIFFKQLYLSKSIFSIMKRCTSFVLHKHTSFSRILNFFIKTILFNIKQFNILMGYNLNFLSNNVNGLNPPKKRSKMFEYFMEKIANNGISFL